MNKPIEISISSQFNKFSQHLQDETNRRILFSGPFGSGKTFFLKQFFKKETDYCPFFIYPVNYSVSQNADIFELLKFDIFFELLSLGITFPDEDKKVSRILWQYSLMEKSSEFLVETIRNTSKIGKNIVSIAEKLVQFEDLTSKRSSSNSSDYNEILRFLKQISKEKGSHIEEDNQTLLIRTLLDQVKEKHGKPVLVIDDLDRIDPDHIFRLFNVFAAHLDKDEENNKFGFERIIFVCDSKNISNLFRAKYGMNVDLSGYLGKFYSSDIFLFDNRASVEEKLREFLQNVKLPNDTYYRFFKVSINTTLYGLTFYILSGPIKCEAINLRSVIKMNRYVFPFETYELKHFVGWPLYNIDLRMLMVLDFIKWILGSGESLYIAIKKAADSAVYKSLRDSGDPFNKFRIGCCITILELEDVYKRQDQINSSSFHYQFHDSEVKVEYQIEKFGERRQGIEASIVGNFETDKIDYFKVLLHVVKKLQDFQLLK